MRQFSGWYYWMEKRVIYLTACVSSFLSRLVSSHEIAINLNRTPVPTVRHGQGDAPYLVSCTAHVSSASQECRDQQRATSTQYIICLLRGPNDETTSPGPCVHEVAFLCRRRTLFFSVNCRP